MNLAQRLLSRRAKSGQALRLALRRRGAEPDVIAEVLTECVRLGYVDDRRHAASMAESLRRRGASRRKIEHKLQENGIGSALVHEILGEESRDEELDAALRYARKRRFGRDPDRHRHQLASLARVGFGYDTARRALEQVQSDWDSGSEEEE